MALLAFPHFLSGNIFLEDGTDVQTSEGDGLLKLLKKMLRSLLNKIGGTLLMGGESGFCRSFHYKDLSLKLAGVLPCVPIPKPHLIFTVSSIHLQPENN